MDATFEGEFEEGLAVSLVDNHGHDHLIVMDEEGEIIGHEADDYPDDPQNRSFNEDESFSQARRFARYHVYREKGYDTIAPPNNPDRIAAVLLTVLNSGSAEFDRHFQTLFEQVASHDFPDIDPPLDLPLNVYSQEALVYKQHVYLEEDLEAMQQELQRPAAEILNEDLVDELLNAGKPTPTAGVSGFTSAVQSLVDGPSDEHGLTIEGVSGIDTMYYEDTNEDRTIKGDDPFDREPDATIELIPARFDEDVFGFYLCYNLLCQIRDCYIGMGVEPPAQYRVLGHGKYKYTGKYRHFDFYPDYWDHEAQISGYLSPV